MPDRILARDWEGSLETSEIAAVEPRDNVIGRVLPLGEIGPAYLEYLRLTEPDDSDMEWAMEQVNKRYQHSTYTGQ